MGLSQNIIRPHCSVCILACPRIAVCCLAEQHERNISRRQSVFQPSTPSLESTLPPVISQANSVEALKSKLAIYLFFFFPLPGRGVIQLLPLPRLRQHSCRNLLLGACSGLLPGYHVSAVCTGVHVAECICSELAVCVCVCVCVHMCMWCSAYFFLGPDAIVPTADTDALGVVPTPVSSICLS